MDREEELRRRRGEHTRSYSQDKPIGSGENYEAIKRGVKQWLPDLIAAPADMADIAVTGAKRALQGQKQRTVTPSGYGHTVRGALSRIQPRQQTEMTETPETDWFEEGTRMLNPLFFANPKNALNPLGALAAIGGAPGSQLSIVKPKGGNWITGPGSEIEDTIKWLLQGSSDNYETLVRKGMLSEADRARKPEFHLNNWLAGPLQKYLKRDLATEADPVRKLAELSPPVSHMPLDRLMQGTEGPWVTGRARGNREAAGYPPAGVAKTPEGKAWETATDAITEARDATPQALHKYYSENAQGRNHPMSADWVKDLPSETAFYDFANDDATGWLGLDHLRDELWNAVREDSDLPTRLKLKPEDFQQMGIEKAIRHVAGINKWREGSKAEVAQEMLSGPGVKLIREYAENNPKGLRWVELSGGNDNRDAIAKQLKYEGDTMGHCVGGYCDDVASGRSRIFSLRDAKGEPHVTIETRPEAKVEADNTSWALNHLLSKEDLQPLYDAASKEGLGTADPAFWEHVSKGVAAHPKWLAYQAAEPAHTLVQAKGKSNKAPKEDYIPFVQDLLRQSPAGKWGEIGESPENLGFKTSEEVKKYIEGYAQGGLVGRQEFNGAVGYILD